MARPIVLDEIHLTVTAPAGLARRRYGRMVRALSSEPTTARVRRAALAALRADPALAAVKIRVSR